MNYGHPLARPGGDAQGLSDAVRRGMDDCGNYAKSLISLIWHASKHQHRIFVEGSGALQTYAKGHELEKCIKTYIILELISGIVFVAGQQKRLQHAPKGANIGICVNRT